MHLPVLQKEVLKYLDPKPDENFIDATFGEGGHSLAILERNAPKGKVLGIELDPILYQKLKERKVERLVLVNDSYANLKEIVREYNFGPIQGILFDLGMSSWHLEESGRGFSFQKDEALDMRYHPQQNPLTAQEILNRWKEKEIERILREYGEERFSRRITREIVRERQKALIKTTSRLVEIVRKAIPGKYQRQKIHSSTRTFQALRTAVNDELANLEKALPQALEVLGKNGRIVVISFHSLEDRIVKNFFRENAKKGLLQILTKKPIVPTAEELQENPRARSAKLRAIIKT